MDDTAAAYAGATLVGFYGEKPKKMQDWLTSLQNKIGARVPTFVPRSLEQIHATVIGLEFRLRPVTAQDVLGLAHSVSRGLEHPVDLRFGGYLPRSSSFTSRGQDPYERAFGLRGGQAIVIGWPFPPTQVLAGIRREAEAFGFRHRYHEPGNELDPDCYLVLGEYSTAPEPSAETEIRDILAADPVHVSLRPADLSLIRYRNTSLDPASSEQIRLPDGLSLAVATQLAAEPPPSHRA
ncbi:hypothetical protein GCM10010435_47940 [Winogradskya consettensis]|uniref:Uncharacterized protein n=1 Tax=Winogradskya consettensis TaxID=113560 RepID=A0A919VRA4_9ACTN|nr:hypothetical protein [Actinoplanes consettensis]GIM72957.1 hypothetical protein Aco04nite_32870 [Actinoplanes consettensis]